ncbi:nuclear transport factor 2 family protein [Mucilaginibacter boryungensis]|uniref:Nuclear transport factor 2 family protein n=1 Tax=Mucilaginibacter boryungensis TaxID=768480 RepID=A0ABR9XFU9_9SPHI|nr:nuclear transport factor 2 family protein [Mucilaginibacter boryungensis]MBE9665935.1 nuclear transport factor 2 family protein [Mucilaginibacter boryungensis]
MDNKQLIEKFYSAFAAGDAEGMVACYADDIEFEDPAFGWLKGRDAKNMWRMLSANNKGVKVTASNIAAKNETGSADWVAEYVFSRTGRKVVNHVHAEFEFKDGKIIKHTDTFNAWKWAGQALGMSGYLLGWSAFMKNKIRQQTKGLLAKYNAKHDG